MCGIAGVYGLLVSPDQRVDYVKSMLGRLRHRGPDEMGYYADADISLGTARLSIVDPLSGQQPMMDDAARYVIAFNGEIYNFLEIRKELSLFGYHFSTKSDTEVLLKAWHRWGTASLEKLNGAFAFCIYDRVEREFYIARDRFGERPLFYATLTKGVIFASEIKSLAGCPSLNLEFSPENLASIFRLWVPVGEVTAFKGVCQVPPGCFIRGGARGIEIVEYAPLKLLNAVGCPVPEGDWPPLVGDRLAKSVELRLRCDAKAGVYLSGGLDSAIVALLMAERSEKPIHSFSVSFQDPDFDEAPEQEIVSSFLGTHHTSIRIGARQIVDSFPDAIWHGEVPVFRTAFVPMFHLAQAARAQGVKVVLTGEGADEAFLGYDLFKETALRAQWPELTSDQRRSRLASIYPYLPQFSQTGNAALYAMFARFSQNRDSPLFSHDLRFHNSHQAGRLLCGRWDGLEPLRNEIAKDGFFDRYDAVQRGQWLEYKTLLAGYLLSTQGDRMVAAHGVENRCPFLDPDVIDVAFRSNSKVYDGVNEKRLLKLAFGSRLPRQIIERPKRPFRAPDTVSFLSEKPEYLDVVFSGKAFEDIEFLDKEYCRKLVGKIRENTARNFSQADNQAFIFLLSVSLLYERFIVRPAKPENQNIIWKTVINMAAA